MPSFLNQSFLPLVPIHFICFSSSFSIWKYSCEKKKYITQKVYAVKTLISSKREIFRVLLRIHKHILVSLSSTSGPILSPTIIPNLSPLSEFCLWYYFSFNIDSCNSKRTILHRRWRSIIETFRIRQGWIDRKAERMGRKRKSVIVSLIQRPMMDDRIAQKCNLSTRGTM